MDIVRFLPCRKRGSSRFNPSSSSHRKAVALPISEAPPVTTTARSCMSIAVLFPVAGRRSPREAILHSRWGAISNASRPGPGLFHPARPKDRGTDDPAAPGRPLRAGDVLGAPSGAASPGALRPPLQAWEPAWSGTNPRGLRSQSRTVARKIFPRKGDPARRSAPRPDQPAALAVQPSNDAAPDQGAGHLRLRSPSQGAAPRLCRAPSSRALAGDPVAAADGDDRPTEIFGVEPGAFAIWFVGSHTDC